MCERCGNARVSLGKLEVHHNFGHHEQDCHVRRSVQYFYRGDPKIPIGVLGMIDDTLAVTKCGNEAIRKTRRYSPLGGPTSSSCGELRPSAKAFFALRAKKELFFAVLAHFWQFLVSSSNHGNI